MRILSYNVNNDYRDVEERAGRVAAIIRAHGVDVAGLQEVTPAFLAALVAALGPGWRAAAPLAASQPYFNALLTTLPGAEARALPFAGSAMGRHAVLLPLANGVTVGTFHLESGPQHGAARAAQAAQLAAAAPATPTLLFGDTNFMGLPGGGTEALPGGFTEALPPDAATFFTYDSATNPQAVPPFRSRLDRVYARPAAAAATARLTLVPDTLVSDHHAVLCCV